MAADDVDEIRELNAQSERALVPCTDATQVRVELRAHQLAAVRRCVQVERGNCGSIAPGALEHGPTQAVSSIGILGDRAGSGKSYVIIALAWLSRHGGEDDDGPRIVPHVRCAAKGHIVTYHTPATTHDLSSTTIIVVPHETVDQWHAYIDAFHGGMRSAVVAGRSQYDVIRCMSVADLGRHSILLVSHTFFPDVASLMCHRQCKVRRLVIDEADTVHISNTTSVLPAHFTWFVTSSFGNLLRPWGGGCSGSGSTSSMESSQQRGSREGMIGPGYVRSIFTDGLWGKAMREMLCAVVVKSCDAFIDESACKFAMHHHKIVCRPPGGVALLAGVVDAGVMHHLNAGDVEGAIQLIDPENRYTDCEHVVMRVVHRLQGDVAALEARRAALSKDGRPMDDQLSVQLDRLQERIACIRERITRSETCCICFGPIRHIAITPCCSNAFCFACVSSWLVNRSKSCPLCKHTLTMADLIVVEENARSSNATALDKLDVLQEHLLTRMKEDASRRMLIFAGFDNSFKLIREVLTKHDVPHTVLKGTRNHIRKLLKAYDDGTIKVMLINAHHFGHGLNLLRTTDIVMFHRLKATLENQIVGRASRFDRAAPLHVWHLVYPDET